MTTKYQKKVPFPGTGDLHDLVRIRTLIQKKVRIERELAHIETDDRKIEEWSLDQAIDALGPADRWRIVQLDLFTDRTDDLAVVITLHPSAGRLRPRRGTACAVVDGIDEVSVRGLAACLEKFRDHDRHRDGRADLEPTRGAAGGDVPNTAPEPLRTWWWRNVTAGALAQVVATMLLALLSVWWAFIR
jgi:hypothetical protein